jgi:hypothetical protein
VLGLVAAARARGASRGRGGQQRPAVRSLHWLAAACRGRGEEEEEDRVSLLNGPLWAAVGL